MSDMTTNPETFPCQACGTLCSVYKNSEFVIMTCPNCGNITRYTVHDYELAVKLRKMANLREKEKEKRYEL